MAKAKKKTSTSKRGRGQPKAIDENTWEIICKAAQFRLAVNDIAELAGVHRATLDREVKRRTGENTTTFRDKKMAPIRQKLARKAIEMAIQGDRTMLIFCLKNFNKWSDNVDDKNLDSIEDIEFEGDES